MIYQLKENKIKSTHQRELVFKTIQLLKEEATQKIIYEKCQNEMDRSTIYRIIDMFLDHNIINRNLNYEGDVYYTIATNEHIHYIDCIKCHKQIEINYCPIVEMEEYIKNQGYTLIGHTIKFDVICDECQKIK